MELVLDYILQRKYLSILGILRQSRTIASLSCLSETHQMLRKTLRDFADNELKPNAAKIDKEHLYPEKQIREMGLLGVMGIEIPEKYGKPSITK